MKVIVQRKWLDDSITTVGRKEKVYHARRGVPSWKVYNDIIKELNEYSGDGFYKTLKGYLPVEQHYIDHMASMLEWEKNRAITEGMSVYDEVQYH